MLGERAAEPNREKDCENPLRRTREPVRSGCAKGFQSPSPYCPHSNGKILFDDIVAEFGHGAGGADGAALKDGKVIAELTAEIQVLLY